MLSFNHSRNDTDVAINTPTYNILTNDISGNPKPKNPAMIADSGDNEIRFNAPVVLNNDASFNAPVVFNNDASFNGPVVFNNDVFGDSIALMEKFTFDTADLSVNDWVTIAKTGTGNTRSLRSDAKFIIEDRQGSHHQSIIFQAGAKYSSGVYIDVEQSSWFAKYKFQALRIAHMGTYDGSVLQAQLTSDPSGVSVSPVTVRIYQNRNSEGWICDLSGSPSSDNSPKVYVNDPSNSGLNTPYSSFTPDISGINIVSPDPNNNNSVQTTTSNFIVDSGVFEVKNSPEIRLTSHEGMLLQCDNNSNVAHPGVFKVGTNEWYFTKKGFDMNGEDVINAANVKAQVFTRRDNTPTYKQITFGTNDPSFNANSKFLEPIIFKNNINANDSKTYLINLSSSNADEGAVIYARDNTNPSNNEATLFNEFVFGGGKRTPVYLTSPTIVKMSVGLIHGSSTYGSNGYELENPQNKPPNWQPYFPCAIIPSGENMSRFSNDSNWNGTSTMVSVPSVFGGDGFIDRIVVYPYRHKCIITGAQGGTQLQFEIWCLNSTQGGYNKMVLEDTTSEYAKRFYKVGYVVTGPSSQEPTNTINYPFNEDNPDASGNIPNTGTAPLPEGTGSPTVRVLKLSASQGKLKVIQGDFYFIYCVVRLVSNQNSINVEFDNVNVNGSTWSNDAVPMTFDVYTHLHCDV